MSVCWRTLCGARWWCVGWTVVLALVVSGCGDAGPHVVPVTGQVTLDGEPVAAAGVVFAPDTPGPSASATTDEEGRFRLQTHDLDGAVVGPYSVTITKSESVGVSSEEGDLSGTLGPGWKLVNHLPEIYGNPAENGLRAVVSEEKDQNHFLFELQSQPDPGAP